MDAPNSAGAAVSLEELLRSLQCPVCLMQYHDSPQKSGEPLHLRCSHLVCTGCFTQLVDTSEFAYCPLCRTPIEDHDYPPPVRELTFIADRVGAMAEELGKARAKLAKVRGFVQAAQLELGDVSDCSVAAAAAAADADYRANMELLDLNDTETSDVSTASELSTASEVPDVVCSLSLIALSDDASESEDSESEWHVGQLTLASLSADHDYRANMELLDLNDTDTSDVSTASELSTTSEVPDIVCSLSLIALSDDADDASESEDSELASSDGSDLGELRTVSARPSRRYRMTARRSTPPGYWRDRGFPELERNEERIDGAEE